MSAPRQRRPPAGLIVLDEIAEGLFGADYDSTRDPEIFGERDPPAREELMARICSDDALRGEGFDLIADVPTAEEGVGRAGAAAPFRSAG